MNRAKQLIKNTFIISFGTFLPKIINVITLPIITACLTKSEYGQYDLITTLVFLVLPVATLQIQSAAFRFLIDARNDDIKKKEIISTILAYSVAASIICVIGVFIILQRLSKVIKALICLYFLSDLLLAVIQQIVRGLSNNKAYSLSSILNSTMNLVVILVAVQFMDKGLIGVLLSMIVGAVIGIIYLICRIELWKYFGIRYLSKRMLKELLVYSWPMIPNNLSNWVLKLSDRLVITAVLGIEANAVYAVANKIPNLLVTVQSTFVYAWQENASLAVNDDDAEKYYTKIFASIYHIIVGIMALIIAGTPIMFKILIRGDYLEAYGQLPILFIGMMFSCLASVLGGIYVAHKKTKNVGITTVLAALCNLSIDLAFVKSWGIYAGSISTLISYLFLTVYRMYNVRKIQRIEYDYKDIFSWISILCLMCIICERNTLLLNILNFFFGIVVAYLSNRELTHNLIKMIREKTNRRKTT